MPIYYVSSGVTSTGIILKYDSMAVLDGGVANSTTLNNEGELYVSSGGTANNTTVNSFGHMEVSSGGTVNSTTLHSGWLRVSSGGTAINTTVNSGWLSVSSGGTANSTTVNYDGWLHVYSGGTATNIVWTPCVGGDVRIEDGAYATFVSEYSGIYYGANGKLLSHTAVMNGKTLGAGLEMYVMNGGVVNSTTVSYGELFIYSGGTAINTTLNYGWLYVESGGVANSTTVSYGELFIYSGGTANNTTVSYGELFIYSGGTANNTTVSSGYLYVHIGGTANSTTLNSFGYMEVSSGGTANSTTLHSCGWLEVDSGGTANNTTVSSGGWLYVESGGTANNTTVSYGELFIYSGGKLTGQISIASNASVFAYSGAILDFDLSALAPCEAARINDLSRISGWTNAVFTLTVDGSQASGIYSLAEGASGFAKTISVMNASGESLGTLTVGNTVEIAGSDYELTLSGGVLSLEITSGGIPSEVISGLVLIDETLSVESGQTYLDTEICEGATLIVSGGGIADNTTVYTEAKLTVLSGGTASNTTVEEDGLFYISSGGTADHVVVSGGRLTVSSGGTATDIIWTPCEGTVFIENGAVATFAEEYSGVYFGSYGQLVSHAAVMTGKQVDESDEMYIMSGGTAAETIADGGSMFVYSGGVATSTTLADGEDYARGRMYVFSGGTASGTVVSGGYLGVSGGTADGAVVLRGLIEVGKGGTANNAVVSCTLEEWDSYDGEDGTWIEYGSMYVSGGVANGISISDGVLIIDSDGTAGNVSVSNEGAYGERIESRYDPEFGDSFQYNPGVHVSAGGRLTGRITLNDRAKVYADNGAVLDFDLTQTSAGAAALLNDLSRVEGAPYYTLTVDGMEGTGTYRLAEGASGFDRTITVQNTLGENLGTISVGKKVTVGDVDYTLNLSDGTLSVEVVSSVVPIPDWTFFPGDFNGDGKDMLAVGSDSTVTIYRNGKPWGLGVTLEDGWEIAGIGDFNGDGTDDFLRVHSSGLVIGEMSDGYGEFSPHVLNFLNEGWDILGTGDFNGNGTDDVLIANPTAASETVGLLGYWESGTTWTLINGYSAEWEMVATGDFNADGKCDMLWKNEFVGDGGLTYNAYCTWIVDDPVDWRMVSVANRAEWSFLCSGDFNGDKMNDIAMINDEGVVGIWGVSDGYLSSWSILSAVTPEWTLAGVADFNGDGTDDIAWANTDTGLVGCWQIENKELASWQTIVTLE